MPTRDYYSRQAKLLRNMARDCSDPDTAAQWLKRAREFDVLAEAVGDSPPMPAKPQPQPQQQQQQQQQKAKPEDEG